MYETIIGLLITMYIVIACLFKNMENKIDQLQKDLDKLRRWNGQI